jgi:hypothetical protein
LHDRLAERCSIVAIPGVMRKPDPVAYDSNGGPQYVFVVARDRPDLLARVTERLRDDARIEVIADRRHRERRSTTTPQLDDRRRAERRRPARYWDDLSVYPTLVAQKRTESSAELQTRATASAREAAALREENRRLGLHNSQLRQEIARLAAILTDAEQSLGTMIARFQALAPPPARDSAPRDD